MSVDRYFQTMEVLDGAVDEVLEPYWNGVLYARQCRPLVDFRLHVDRWYGACEHILTLTARSKLPPTILHGRDWDKRK